MNNSIKQALQALPDQRAPQIEILSAVQRVQALLDNISAAIQTDKQHSVEMAEVSAQRDRVEYELASKVTLLTNAERRIADLAATEKLALQEREQLKEELAILRSKPYVDPETPVLLRETQRQNSDLQSQISRLQDDVLAKASAAQLHENQGQALQRELSQLKDALQQSEQKAVFLEQRVANSEAETDRQIEKMRLSFLEGLEKEKAAINSKHLEAIHQSNAKKEQLTKQTREHACELAALKESLATAKQEVQRLQKSQEAQESSSRAQNMQMKNGIESLKKTEAQLRKKIEEGKATEMQLLNKLNSGIRSSGGNAPGDLYAAVELVLARLDRLTNTEKSSATNESFHTAKSQATPNTAVARTVSRGSDDNEAVADAIDFLEALSPSTETMGPWDTQETLVAGHSQNLPPKRACEQQPHSGKVQGLRKPDIVPRGNETTRSSADAGIIVAESYENHSQSDVMTPELAEHSRGSQRKINLEQFISHVGSGRLRRNDRPNATDNSQTPRTPPRQGTSMPNGQQHSNSSARRHIRAEPIQRLRPVQKQEGTTGVSRHAIDKTEAMPGSVAVKQQTTSYGVNRTHNSAADADTHPRTDATATNKFGDSIEKGPKSILKKRKIDDVSQESDIAPGRRRPGKGPTEGLGPVIDGPKTPKGLDKARAGPKVRKSKRLGAQGKQALSQSFS